jgi:DNA mismatch repair protein MSH6
LGRGTSTFDGTAIASATVKHLVERSRCLSLFASHFHSLLDDWRNEPSVRLGHMQCIVDETTESEGGDNENKSITFLYTLGPGTCPKSFGVNVARLARLPEEVLLQAKQVSAEFEEEVTAGSLNRAKAAAFHKKQIMDAIQSGNWDCMLALYSSLASK